MATSQLNLSTKLNAIFNLTNVLLAAVFIMKNYKDLKDKELTKGDIINLHQTVNGQNLFVVMNLNPLTMVYAHDLLREYEYGHYEMLAPSKFTGETDWEIINNIYNLIPDVSY